MNDLKNYDTFTYCLECGRAIEQGNYYVISKQDQTSHGFAERLCEECMNNFLAYKKDDYKKKWNGELNFKTIEDLEKAHQTDVVAYFLQLLRKKNIKIYSEDQEQFYIDDIYPIKKNKGFKFYFSKEELV